MNYRVIHDFVFTISRDYYMINIQVYFSMIKLCGIMPTRNMIKYLLFIII